MGSQFYVTEYIVLVYLSLKRAKYGVFILKKYNEPFQ